MPKQQAKKHPRQSVTAGSTIKRRYLFMLIPAIATLILYFPALHFEFVPNWDDGGYILNNPVIQTLNKENLQEIFTGFYKGNYHPLTTLVYALTYAVAGKDPFLYHLINILFHTINLLLVFILINRLLKDEWIAFWVAMLFGIHPMHIESVAWISELKDVLYTFFYLLTLLSYQKYISSNQGSRRWRLYAMGLLFFLFSLGSKSAAVTLSMVLFLVDWLSKREFTIKTLLDKVPFLLLSVIFGIIAMMSQGKQGAIQDLTPLFTIGERFFIVSYAVMIYVVKFLAPFSLSAMYPYPARADGMLPMEVYASLPVLIVLLVLLALSIRRTRVPLFGGLFFLATASLTLQIIPVGGAIVAERYTYIPYIGLSIIPLFYLHQSQLQTKFSLNWQNLLLTAATIFLFILSVNRLPVWKDGIILFSDVIEKYPNLPFAYNNRGYAYQTHYGDDDKAFADYNQAIAIDSTYHQSLSNRGVLQHSRGMYEESIADFTRSLRYNPSNTDALVGRANTLSQLQRFEEALPDYDIYLRLMPQHAQAWLWRAVAAYHAGDHEASLSNLQTSLQLNPRDDEAYYWMGLNYQATGRVEDAILALDRALQMNPRRFQAWTWKGIIHQSSASYQEAIDAYTKAVELNPNDFSAYYNRALCLIEIQGYNQAVPDLEKALALGYPVNPLFLQEIRIKSKR